jgi:hypothetical protein
MTLDHNMAMKMRPITNNGVVTNHTIRPNLYISANLGLCGDDCS